MIAFSWDHRSVEALILVAMLGIVIAYLFLAHWVATRAQHKGKSYNVFFAAALLTSPFTALLLVELVSADLAQVGDVVRTLQRTKLDDGTVIQRGFRSEVHDIKVIDLTQVVQVDGPTDRVWIARANVRRV